MCSERASRPRPARGRRLALCLLAGSAALLAACDEPPPRSFAQFMDDSIAREGTLARCNEDRQAAAGDIECANARRAQATIALREERARREELERESERKLADLRDEMAWRAQAERDAAAAAEAAAQAAYEAFWRENSRDNVGAGTAVPDPVTGEAQDPAAGTGADPELGAIELPSTAQTKGAEANPQVEASQVESNPEVEDQSIPRPYRRRTPPPD